MPYWGAQPRKTEPLAGPPRDCQDPQALRLSLPPSLTGKARFVCGCPPRCSWPQRPPALRGPDGERVSRSLCLDLEHNTTQRRPSDDLSCSSHRCGHRITHAPWRFSQATCRSPQTTQSASLEPYLAVSQTPENPPWPCTFVREEARPAAGSASHSCCCSSARALRVHSRTDLACGSVCNCAPIGA